MKDKTKLLLKFYMKLLFKPRQGGKTTELIKISAKENIYIVCSDRSRVSYIMELARVLKLSIPFPMTFDEVKRKQYLARGIKKILIDDADEFLQSSIPDLEIETITITKH